MLSSSLARLVIELVCLVIFSLLEPQIWQSKSNLSLYSLREKKGSMSHTICYLFIYGSLKNMVIENSIEFASQFFISRFTN